MFDHVGIRTADRAASQRFYELVLGTLGIELTASKDWLAEWSEFALSPVTPDKPATRGLHLGFAARSREAVDAFWRAGIEAGYRDDGAPGPRPQYRADYYGGFLLDPDGNSVEAVHHGAVDERRVIDHLWIRVRSLPAARAFWELVAGQAGFELAAATSERIQFRGDGSSFSLVPGPPTAHLHVAFPAADRTAVAAFHRTLVAAGHPDNGGPGERPEYHPGYYGAFVCDPDGTNVEMVVDERER